MTSSKQDKGNSIWWHQNVLITTEFSLEKYQCVMQIYSPNTHILHCKLQLREDVREKRADKSGTALLKFKSANKIRRHCVSGKCMHEWTK